MSKYRKMLVDAVRDNNILNLNIMLTKLGTADFQYDTHRQTPLHLAAKMQLPDIVEILIQNGANVNRQNRAGRSALHVATESGDLETVKTLVANGADVNLRTENRITPFDIAIFKNFVPIKDYLKEHGGL